MQRESSHLPANALRSFLVTCVLAALVLFSAVAVAGACPASSSAHPGKAPAVASAPRTTAPKQASPMKACPASTRYNPKTGRCDKYRF
jgi:hypothetical protein